MNSNIRLVLLSGDWIPLGLPDSVKKCFEESEVISLGGATEASIWSIYYPIKEVKSEWSSIPYGMPLANQRMYVLNYKQTLCPFDVQGEIYIGGVGVAKEYKNDDVKTRKAFIEHETLGRLYRTGDYGVMRKEEDEVYIEFLGRRDSQVKIRGYRVELGEIEKNIIKNPEIKNAIVVSKKDQNNNQVLCAYIILENNCSIENETIRSNLSKDLPDYMIPTHFIPLTSIPLSQNGKINYKALPIIEFKSDRVFAEATTDAEQLMIEIFESVLGKEPIGIDDNFFDLGGDSIQLIRAHTKLSERVNINISVLFEKETPRKIAQYIKENALLQSEGIYTKFNDIKNEYRKILESPMDLTEEGKQFINEYREAYLGLPIPVIKKEKRNILLMGASGYLGIYLLREILDYTEDHVYLIVRKRADKTIEEAIERIWKEYHPDADINRYDGRITYMEGDLCSEAFALSEENYKLLINSVDDIINSAANINHYVKYEESYAINVQGVKNLIQLAKVGRKKVLHHFSTIRVAEGKIDNKPFVLYTESCGNLNQKSNNVYNITKLEAEEALFEARKEGVIANIYRIGNLQCSSTTGITQINSEKNAFMSTIRAFIKIKKSVITPWDNLNFTFINEEARALNLLIHSSYAVNETFHVQSKHDIKLSSMVERFNQIGYSIEQEELPEFLDYLTEIKDQEELKEYLDIILLHSGIMGLAEKDRTVFMVFSEKTDHMLEGLGFQWGEMNDVLFKKMVNDYKKKGFLDR